MGSKEQNLWGANMPKVPIIDQTDKFILKKSEKRKKQQKRASQKILGGPGAVHSRPPGSFIVITNTII